MHSFQDRILLLILCNILISLITVSSLNRIQIGYMKTLITLFIIQMVNYIVGFIPYNLM